MTDFTTDTMIPARRIRLAGLAKLLQSIPGRMVAPLVLLGKASVYGVVSYGRALELAFSPPVVRPPQNPRHDLDEDLNGRDPNW